MSTRCLTCMDRKEVFDWKAQARVSCPACCIQPIPPPDETYYSFRDQRLRDTEEIAKSMGLASEVLLDPTHPSAPFDFGVLAQPGPDAKWCCECGGLIMPPDDTECVWCGKWYHDLTDCRGHQCKEMPL